MLCCIDHHDKSHEIIQRVYAMNNKILKLNADNTKYIALTLRNGIVSFSVSHNVSQRNLSVQSVGGFLIWRNYVHIIICSRKLLNMVIILHREITMVRNTVPYYRVTTLVPHRSSSATSLEYLHCYLGVPMQVLQQSSCVGTTTTW